MSKTLLVLFALFAVSAFANPIDVDASEDIVEFFTQYQKLNGYSDNIDRLVSDVLQIERCVNEIRTIFYDALQTIYYRRPTAGVIEGLLQVPAIANGDCVSTANVAQYVILNALQTVGYAVDKKYTPFKDQLVTSDDITNPTAKKTIAALGNFNAFFACLIGNFKLANQIYNMETASYFDYSDHLALLSYLDTFRTRYNYNAEQCKKAQDLVNDALKWIYGN